MHLSGCGVDGERIDRFEHLVDQQDPCLLVFTPEEISHAGALDSPAEGLCAAFCCKEAVYKALECPFNFVDCELLFDPACSEQVLHLSPALRNEFDIAEASARVMRAAEGECVAVVCLWSRNARTEADRPSDANTTCTPLPTEGHGQ